MKNYNNIHIIKKKNGIKGYTYKIRHDKNLNPFMQCVLFFVVCTY